MPKVVAKSVAIDTDEQLEVVNSRGTYDYIFFEASPSASEYSAYASASDVSILCRNLLNGEDGFSASSSPSLTAINTWLSSGCSVIESRLATDGYSVPILQDTLLYGWLKELNALFGASKAEYSRLNISVTPGERTRGQLFEDKFWKQLDALCAMDLTTIGAIRNESTISSMPLFVGGTSKSQKGSTKSNTDRVNPRFSKNMFDLPNTNHVTEDN